VSQAIADRIERAIQWGHAFHAYIVLPVHPEGHLNDLAIMGQIHWTMQSLVFASDSLVNRVRLALYAKENCKQPRNQAEWEAAKKKGLSWNTAKKGLEYDVDVPLEATHDYLTLLNLRNCQTVGGKVRTEQIYVHTKLLIVDDRFVIVGSANINDRSLAGGRDSELAVLLMDLSTHTAPMDGKNPLHVRKLAHELRVKLWKKHFALSGHSDLVQPATGLQALVDKPADPATWRAIQAVAQSNADVYAKAFKWVPRDEASIWPVWDLNRKFIDDPNTKGNEADPDLIRREVGPFEAKMPFSEDFWKSKTAQPPTALGGIKGFICALPMLWTQGENNHPDMNMALLTRLDLPESALPDLQGEARQAKVESIDQDRGQVG
jgi:phospholipase D1/2